MSRVMELLHEAYKASGLTLDQLANRADLDVDRTQMSRKIRGITGCTPDDSLRIARALGVRVECTGKTFRARKVG